MDYYKAIDTPPIWREVRFCYKKTNVIAIMHAFFLILARSGQV
jgi:hypothetical protein